MNSAWAQKNAPKGSASVAAGVRERYASCGGDQLADTGGMNAKPAATRDEIGKLLAGQSTDTLRVATVPGDIGIALGTQAGEVLLSRYTADKQRKHPEITADSFAWLQELLNHGERCYDKIHHATIIWHCDPPYMAALKVTADGKEVYLQSFRRTDEKNIKSLRKRVEGAGDG